MTKKLVKCRECGKEVSKSAKICPHCGAKKPYKSPAMMVLGGGIVILLLLLAVFTDHSEETEEQNTDMPALEAKEIAQEKAKILAEEAQLKKETEKLANEMDKLDSAPCSSQLRFTHIFGEWYVTCDGCAAAPAKNFLPKRMIRHIDENAIGNKITLPKVLEALGTCP